MAANEGDTLATLGQRSHQSSHVSGARCTHPRQSRVIHIEQFFSSPLPPLTL